MTEDRARYDELAHAAGGGDTAAFEELVRLFTPLVWAHALRFFGDPVVADDVVQEVSVKVLRALPGYEGRAAFTTWLFTVTRTTCIDMLRAAQRRAVPADPLDALSVDDDTAMVDLQVSLEAAMRGLPPEERDALSAVAVFGLSYDEASAALDVPAGTVKSRVFRARRGLAAVLPREGRA